MKKEKKNDLGLLYFIRRGIAPGYSSTPPLFHP